MAEVQMPRLSDSMEEGTVLKWLKAPGDHVSRGEDLVEIETDKATMTFQSDADGRLEIIAREGDTLPIGAVIARLEGEATAPVPPAPVALQGTPPVVAAPTATAPAPPVVAAPTATPPAPVADPPPPPGARSAPGPPDDRIRASPIARRIAREQGLDLGQLTGTGPGGRIVRADVDGAAVSAAPAAAPGRPADTAPTPPAAPAQPTAVPAAPTTGPQAAPLPAVAPVAVTEPGPAGPGAKGRVTVQEPTRAQQVVARRMSSSKATVPEFTLSSEIDMERCVELRARLAAMAGEGPVPSYNDIVVKACALALREHPRANGAWRDGRFELYSRVNVGVAVAGDGILVVPTVFDADQRPLGQIAVETRRLAQRVRDGEITPPELAGATFTVSNLGMFGVRSFTAVINPPQAAILAVGAVTGRPVVRDGAVVAGQAMDVTLSCDHRILYGAEAARFLARVRELLEEPLGLLS